MKKSKQREMEEYMNNIVGHSDPECPLCDRPIPKSQQDKHHLIPKVKKGKETEVIHRACHRQIHALFNEGELAKHYCSPEALRAHPEMQKFIKWIQTKPNDYLPSVKASVDRRRQMNK